jgi:PKD repeat protein
VRGLTHRFAALIILAVLSAGCTASVKDPKDDAPDDALLGDDASDLPGDTNITALPKVALLKVDLPNGTAPLNVTFTVDAENRDGATAWELDFGDGTGTASGTQLPSNATHSYALNGTFNATVSIHYDDGEVVNATTSIVVEPGGPLPGAVLRVEIYDKTETILVGAQTTSCGSGVNAGSDTAWEIPAAGPDGIPNLVSNFAFTMTASGPGAVDVDIEVRGPDGVVGSGTSSGPNESFSVEGAFPPGVYTVDVDGCAAVNASVTVHGEATMVAA